MMDKKQLDFSAPLLSVRRFSLPSNFSEPAKMKMIEKLQTNRQQSLPSNKSVWEYEEVTRSGAIPFHWEQIPGRPKTGEVEIQVHTPNSPSNAPRLPPGRLSDGIRYNSCKRSNDQKPYGAKLQERLSCKDESDIETDDDRCSGAIGTLSQAESWSLNYGVSGYQSSCVEPSGNFSIDEQTRDFMMSRFLPAAKAVVWETPKYVVKKPRMVEQQLKEVKNVVLGENDILPYLSQHTENLGSENEEKKYSVSVKKSGKSCGGIPWFCAKNSLCLLNTLSGTKSEFHNPTSSARRLTRNAHSGPLDLDKSTASYVAYKRKSHSGVLSRDLPEMKNKLTSYSISPYRNEYLKTQFLDEEGFVGAPKEVENYMYNANKTTTYAVKSSDQETSCVTTILEEGKELSPKYGSSDEVQSSTCIYKLECVANEMDGLDQESRPMEYLESDDQRDGCDQIASLKSHLAPPLPKSPSESWLWRKMPSMYLANPVSNVRNHVYCKKRDPKGDNTNAKRKTFASFLSSEHISDSCTN